MLSATESEVLQKYNTTRGVRLSNINLTLIVCEKSEVRMPAELQEVLNSILIWCDREEANQFEKWSRKQKLDDFKLSVVKDESMPLATKAKYLGVIINLIAKEIPLGVTRISLGTTAEYVERPQTETKADVPVIC